MRLWGGRFSEANDARVEAFTSSIEIDRELAADDLAGSIAHVHGLGRAGLLTEAQVDELVAGLTALAEDVAADRLAWDPALEDVHLNLEAALADRIGPAAGRLHTGRSRNDQVATDLRLWTRRADRPARRRARRLRARARRARGARRRGRPARHHPHPAGAAGAVRPPPARLRRDGRARSRPPRRRPPAPQRESARGRRARGRRLSARSHRDGPGARASTASPRTRSMRSATATSSSRCSRPSPSGWST